MCVRDGAGDQTQGSKEDINWKESLMLQSNSVKKKIGGESRGHPWWVTGYAVQSLWLAYGRPC